jgi:hypothetical protein
MVLYSMSPRAYEGLMNLARDPHWCADYARILRYLDVVVSLKEAALVGEESGMPPADHATWTRVAFVETQGATTADPATVIKKL